MIAAFIGYARCHNTVLTCIHTHVQTAAQYRIHTHVQTAAQYRIHTHVQTAAQYRINLYTYACPNCCTIPY